MTVITYLLLIIKMNPWKVLVMKGAKETTVEIVIGVNAAEVIQVFAAGTVHIFL
jgi:hypothetical protein